MGKMKLVTVAVVLMVAYVCGIPYNMLIQRVKVGETTVLPCLTLDDFHRFQYWQLNDDRIIGPWNNNATRKIKYEIWSGKLVIKSVTESESGIYKCFSKRLKTSEMISATIEVLVMKDWRASYASDMMVNTYRAIVAVLVLLLVALMGIFLCYIRRGQMADLLAWQRGSLDAMIAASQNRGVYRTTNMNMYQPQPHPSTSRAKQTDLQTLETAVVETDISTSFSLPNN